MRVIDRDMPIDRVALAAGLPGESAQVRQNKIRNTQIGLVILQLAHGIDAHAKISQLHVESRRRVSRDESIMGLVGAAHASVTLVTLLEKAMQIRKMNRINVAFVRLQIIAFVKDLRDVEMIRRSVEKIIVG